ncbi:MAG: 2-oxoacid:acceptor oxidoreductase family protein [Deltaproteobacteria bacterium]|nr:2-oxoacid:acceptor oxidoreductase family protein [Deltaproteobacteria bacterium]
MNAPRRGTYLNERFGALAFCPGCGHAQLVKAIDRALVKLQPDPSKVVIVTDIGCIGLSDRYFITSAFHGLHGRSITYACGIKLARPELRVIVLMGDGGCGIGATHLLNVARRNIAITLIIANNLNYGMTGGQHSVTTPFQGITSSCPEGNIETPIDLCATVAAAGGSWVYRGTVFDRALSDVIVGAIEHRGFSMLEVWELCTAYYAPRNKLDKKGLLSLLDRSGFKTGMIANAPRPEYSEQLRRIGRKKQTLLRNREQPIKEIYDNTVGKQIGIVLAGSAGQKIRSAATLFAQASMLAGLNATQKDDYPITVQTGHSVSEIILSPERIDYTAIDSPDYVVLISQDGFMATMDRFRRLTEHCTIFAHHGIELPQTNARCYSIAFAAASEPIGRNAIVIVALAVLLQISGLFPLEAFSDAIRRFSEKNAREINLHAVRIGKELAKKTKKE